MQQVREASNLVYLNILQIITAFLQAISHVAT